jgi:hypothetical protein
MPHWEGGGPVFELTKAEFKVHSVYHKVNMLHTEYSQAKSSNTLYPGCEKCLGRLAQYLKMNSKFSSTWSDSL